MGWIGNMHIMPEKHLYDEDRMLVYKAHSIVRGARKASTHGSVDIKQQMAYEMSSISSTGIINEGLAPFWMIEILSFWKISTVCYIIAT